MSDPSNPNCQIPNAKNPVLGGRYRTQVGLTGFVLAAPVLGGLILEWMVARSLGPAPVGWLQKFLIPAQALAAMGLLGLPTSMSWLAARATGQGQRVSPGLAPACALVVGLAVWVSWSILPRSWMSLDLDSSTELGSRMGVLCGWMAALTAVAAILEPVLIGLGRSLYSAVISGLSILVMVGVGALAISHSQDGGLIAIPLASIAGAGLRILGALGIILGRHQKQYPIAPFPPEARSFVYMAALVALIDAASTWADRLIVSGAQVEPSILALYRYGAREVPLLGALLGAMSQVALTRLSAQRGSGGLDGGRLSAEHQLWSHSVAVSWMLIIPLGAWLMVHAPLLFQTIYGKEWAGAGDYFRVYLMLLILRAMPLMALLQSDGQRKVVLWGSVLDLAIAGGLCGFLVLGLGYPPIAAAVAYVIGTYVQAGYYLVFIQRRWGTIIPWKDLVWSLLVAIGIGVAGWTLNRLMPGWSGVILHSLLSFGWVALQFGQVAKGRVPVR